MYVSEDQGLKRFLYYYNIFHEKSKKKLRDMEVFFYGNKKSI
jgi:hypothetical protein